MTTEDLSLGAKACGVNRGHPWAGQPAQVLAPNSLGTSSKVSTGPLLPLMQKHLQHVCLPGLIWTSETTRVGAK